MKLLNRSTLYYLLFLLPVMVISGFVFHFIIVSEVEENMDELLVSQKNTVESRFVLNDTSDLHYYNDADDDVKIRILPAGEVIKEQFTDIYLYDSAGAEMGTFRRFSASFVKNGKNYGIIITRSNIKSEELAESITISMVIMSGLLLIGFIFANRIISKNLFKPFYESLEKLNTLSFSEMQPGIFIRSAIKEFNELNNTLNKMIAKMLSDYNNQKQFTENAAHELQTPLAVIKLRIDLLIQSKTISGEDMEQIQDIERSVSKITHLNKTLLLLSKIENRQFNAAESIELSPLIEKIFVNFEDHLKNKNLSLNKKYAARPVLQINPMLAEILFSNLIQNAIRYNQQNGSISVTLTEKSFLIYNPGPSLQGNENKLFNRFAKFNPSAESLGLGLAIVKQVCDYYNYNVRYSYVDNQHCFFVDFSN